MKSAMRIKVWLLLPALALSSCYSAGGGDDDRADTSSGGHSSGGSSSGGGASSAGSSATGGSLFGGSSSGGSSSGAAGGTDQCGACPGYACSTVVMLQIAPDPAVAPANLSQLDVSGEGLELECSPNADCTVSCFSNQYQIPDGHYSLVITAPGFLSQTLEFDAVNPTNCGCCGCCPFSFSQQVTLTSDGSAVESCCADTRSDAMNCGGCGIACLDGESCVEGTCQVP